MNMTTRYKSGEDPLRTIHTDDGSDAPGTCARLETERADGWVVTAWRDGKLVADAEGWVRPVGPDPFDLACERRYD